LLGTGAGGVRLEASTGPSVIKRGDSSFQMFAIEKGELEVCSKEETLAKVGTGQVVGEIGAGSAASSSQGFAGCRAW